MNQELITINNNQVMTIKSTELVEIINQFREMEGENKAELQHKSFMAKIRKELETLKLLELEGQKNILPSSYVNLQGKEQPCYELTRDGMLQMLNSESTLVRYKTIEYINKLENQLNNPVQKYLDMCEEDRAIAYFTKLKETKKLEKENEEKNKLLLKQGNEISLLNDFLNSKDLYSIDVVSKTFAIKGLGRNNLYKYLRDNKILMTDWHYFKNIYGKTKKTGGLKHYTAYAQYTNEQQYFKHRQRNVKIGESTIKQNYAMLTAKGVSWLYNKLQKDEYIEEKDLNSIIEELKDTQQVA